MSNLLEIKYNTKTFEEVFPSDDEFIAKIKNTVFYTSAFSSMLTDEMLQLNFALLYNKYGGSPIANSSEDKFISKVFGIIWQYGPNWVQKLKIQEKLRSLGIDDNSEIYKGSSAIYNHALNPETAPSTATLDELTYINDQNTTKYKRSRLEGLAQLMDLLTDSFTDDYINKFRKLFRTIVSPERTYVFVNEEDEGL